ncbi:MAG: T9SS type A sorting domain-containing protein, partial [Bacteroidota bacterium]
TQFLGITTVNRPMQILVIIAPILILCHHLGAQAIMEPVLGGATSIEIRIETHDPVAALQFTIEASSHLVLGTPEKGGSLSESGWMLTSHRVNDSTVNVVLWNSQLLPFQPGAGTVAVIPFSNSPSNSRPLSRIRLNKVVLADPGAASIPVVLRELTWPTDPAQVMFALDQNYPNPFNPSTTIPYRIEVPGHVRLSVFDIAGREIANLVGGHHEAGSYTVPWTTVDAAGGSVPSGLYFVRLQVGSEVQTRKMIVTK